MSSLIIAGSTSVCLHVTQELARDEAFKDLVVRLNKTLLESGTSERVVVIGSSDGFASKGFEKLRQAIDEVCREQSRIDLLPSPFVVRQSEIANRPLRAQVSPRGPRKHKAFSGK